MNLRTTDILELLKENPGSYVQHDAGNYRLKNVDGSDMTKAADGKVYLLEPSDEMIDDLMNAGRLKRDGQRYTLA